MRDLEEKLASLNRQISTITGERDSYRAELGRKKIEIEGLEEEIARLKRRIAELESMPPKIIRETVEVPVSNVVVETKSEKIIGE